MTTVSAPPGRIPAGTVILRRYSSADAGKIGQAVTESLEHLRPWMPWVAREPVPLAERVALIERWDAEWADGKTFSYGIFRNALLVGGCGLHRRIAPDGLEIGYWVHVQHTRRGYASAAAAALTSAAFKVPGVTHVEIHHDKANVASGGVPAKLGFELDAEIRESAGFSGEIGVGQVWRMSSQNWLPQGESTGTVSAGRPSARGQKPRRDPPMGAPSVEEGFPPAAR